VKRAYYSTPPEYVGCRVWVRWNEQTVRILNENFKQISVHPRRWLSYSIVAVANKTPLPQTIAGL
jgi:hypothetical protein